MLKQDFEAVGHEMAQTTGASAAFALRTIGPGLTKVLIGERYAPRVGSPAISDTTVREGRLAPTPQEQWRVARPLHIAVRMISFSNASHHMVLAAILPLLAAPWPAGGATVRGQKPRAATSTPVKANNAIIALPLNPVVPAGQRLCSAKTPSGLGFTMLRPGAGSKPARSDVALVNYVGYLAATGAVFDQGMRSPLPVDGVIPGFSEGLQMMAKSGVTRFCIPAALGYGGRTSGPIPANSDLIFQVELVDFKTAAEVESMNSAPVNEATAPMEAAPQQK